MQNAGLDEAQAGIKIVRRNTNNLRYTADTTLMAESEGLGGLARCSPRDPKELDRTEVTEQQTRD